MGTRCVGREPDPVRSFALVSPSSAGASWVRRAARMCPAFQPEAVRRLPSAAGWQRPPASLPACARPSRPASSSSPARAGASRTNSWALPRMDLRVVSCVGQARRRPRCVDHFTCWTYGVGCTAHGMAVVGLQVLAGVRQTWVVAQAAQCNSARLCIGGRSSAMPAPTGLRPMSHLQRRRGSCAADRVVPWKRRRLRSGLLTSHCPENVVPPWIVMRPDRRSTSSRGLFNPLSRYSAVMRSCYTRRLLSGHHPWAPPELSGGMSEGPVPRPCFLQRARCRAPAPRSGSPRPSGRRGDCPRASGRCMARTPPRPVSGGSSAPRRRSPGTDSRCSPRRRRRRRSAGPVC